MSNKNKIGITFKDSKEYPIHRWYPYVEGFSAPWVKYKIKEHKISNMKIYDPFGGCGTTHLEASLLGIESFYSEVNPFMRFVLETKINSVREIVKEKQKYIRELNSIKEYIVSDEFLKNCNKNYIDMNYKVFLENDYFEENHLNKLAHILDYVEKSNYGEHTKKIAKLAVAAIAVDSSNMTRRADLRRRREGEYKDRVVDIQSFYLNKLTDMIEDILITDEKMEKAVQILSDSKDVNTKYMDFFDLVITSPPYINGTNYIRNTTIELILSKCIESDAELKDLKKKTVCGGISDATKDRNNDLIKFEYVEDVARQLDINSKDKRIPLMVRSYFSDMYKVMKSVYYMMKENGYFVLDIGDSKFYNVYVPTDDLLLKLANEIGFKLVNNEIIAARYSRDKTQLKQAVITLKK